MKLYDFEMAPNPRRVRMFLAEKGIKVPTEQINTRTKEQFSEAFLKVNPRGTVPVLELDDGTTITESVSICRYFEDLHPEPALFGRDAKEKALEEGTYSQSPQDLEAFKQFSMCINCMLCYAACPVIANEPSFLGPAAIALGHRYNQDSRDDGAAERNEVFREDGGVFACSYANECSEVCPKNVDPAAAVNQAKFNAVIDWATGLVMPRGGKE